jgi:hypothetical protein
MPASDHFPATYRAARERFLAAARAAGARVTTYANDAAGRGPDLEPLATDVAVVGAAEPESALVVISGTHGVEGFAGSGCQTALLAGGLADALAPSQALVLVHAMNPHGFAWWRRVTEENVDLNRNFVDHDAPAPPSDAYDAVHPFLVPDDWDGPAREAADAALAELMRTRGQRALQQAVQGGQYTHPDGLFYGGRAPTWSRRTLERIVAECLPASLRRVAILDLHTGLGPTGHGELLYAGGRPDERERAEAWLGEVRSTRAGTSVAADVQGDLLSWLAGALAERGVEVTPVALEFGTAPLPEVLTALRGDAWLHARADRTHPLAEGIRRRLLAAFLVDTPEWKGAVCERTADVARRALGRLA